MSAPDTNLNKQKRNHRGPLVGIGAALLFAGGLFVAYMTLIWEPVADDTAPAATAPIVETN